MFLQNSMRFDNYCRELTRVASDNAVCINLKIEK